MFRSMDKALLMFPPPSTIRKYMPGVTSEVNEPPAAESKTIVPCELFSPIVNFEPIIASAGLNKNVVSAFSL